MKLGLSSSLERPFTKNSNSFRGADGWREFILINTRTFTLWQCGAKPVTFGGPSRVQTWVRILPGANLTNDENLPEDAKEPNCNTSTDPYRPWCHASVADGCCRCCDRPYQALARSRSLHMWASAFHAHASSLQPDAPSLQPDVSSLQPLRQGSLPPPPQLRPRLKDLAIGKHKSEEDGAGDTPRGRQPVRPNAPIVRGIDKRTVGGENQREFATRRAVCSRSYSVQLRAA
eukprot:scaffold19366_cov71-Phaeocystis_antarctica.AAC.7